MVSEPPVVSVQPVMVGGAERVTVFDGEDGVIPLAEKLVQLTVMGIELMSPTKVMSVPALSEAVTVVPPGRVA